MRQADEGLKLEPGQKVPPIQRVRRPGDIRDITFTDALAAVEVDAPLLPKLPLKNWRRGAGPRLSAVLRSIRDRGWIPSDPIICRIGRAGRWVVVDGGHRLTAIHLLRSNPFSWLFGPRIDTVYVLLFLDSASWVKVRSEAERIRAGAPVQLSALPEQPDLSSE